MKNFKILDGNIDLEKFKSGKYIIYEPFGKDNENSAVCAGDMIDAEIFDDITKQYVSKQFEVMAVVRHKDKYGSDLFSGIFGICMLDETFKEIYPNYNELIASVAFDSSNTDDYENQKEEIKSLMKEYSEYNINMTSKYDVRQFCMNQKKISIIVGSFFTIFFAVIGITNVMNGFINNVLSNKIAYARMQAIGMTKR